MAKTVKAVSDRTAKEREERDEHVSET
jgi:hypothetical protein